MPISDKVLPDFKPKPKFNIGDKVKTYKGNMLIQSHYGYSLIDGAWVPIYICVPMNKKGEPDLRSKNKRTNTFLNQFNETNITEA